MFGYVRPLQAELTVRELHHFKALYCGLCHSLGKKYGLSARLVLNYELVFLSMLIWDCGEQPEMLRGRCIASPLRKKMYCARNHALEVCAGYNIILAWWKLKDTIEDETFLKSLPHRFAAFLMSGAYKKAARDYSAFDERVRRELISLKQYESQGDGSIDAAADKFAGILSAAAPEEMPVSARRPIGELLYHLGRWIYLIDAYDDYKDDAAAGRFNPIASRFQPEGAPLSDGDVERLKTTLTHSNNLLCSAFELLPANTWASTVRNTIYLGMPDICSRVLSGASVESKDRHKHFFKG